MQTGLSLLVQWRDGLVEALGADEEFAIVDLESGATEDDGEEQTGDEGETDSESEEDDVEQSDSDIGGDNEVEEDYGTDGLDDTEALWTAAEEEMGLSEHDFVTNSMTLYLTYVPGIMVAVMFFISVDQQEACPEIPLVPWLSIHITNGFLIRPVLERFVFRPYEDRTGRRLYSDYALDVLSSGWYFVGCVWFFGGPWQECRNTAPVLTSMMLGLLLYPLILVTVIVVLMCVLPVCCIPCLDIFEFFFIGGEPLVEGVRRRAGKKKRKKGLSGRQLAALVPMPFAVATEKGHLRDGDMACVICLTEYEDADLVCCLSCAGGHVFHKQCADQWLGKKSTCPSCRGKIKVPLSRKEKTVANKPERDDESALPVLVVSAASAPEHDAPSRGLVESAHLHNV
jgi:hypothetical protein